MINVKDLPNYKEQFEYLAKLLISTAGKNVDWEEVRKPIPPVVIQPMAPTQSSIFLI